MEGCQPQQAAMLLTQQSSALTPLQAAAAVGDVAAVQKQLDAGANIHAITVADCNNLSGLPPIHLAVMFGHPMVAELLLQRGGVCCANVSAGDAGLTPLHQAALQGLSTMAQLLLDAGADVTACDHCSRQPLHLAAARGSDSVAKLLLGRGADVTVRDSARHRTPLSEAANSSTAALLVARLPDGADALSVLDDAIEVSVTSGRFEVCAVLLKELARRNPGALAERVSRCHPVDQLVPAIFQVWGQEVGEVERHEQQLQQQKQEMTCAKAGLQQLFLSAMCMQKASQQQRTQPQAPEHQLAAQCL